MRFLLIILLAALSCTKSKYSAYEKAVNNFINDNSISNNSRIIIIPRAGCSSCISDATFYVLENYKLLENTYVIFTEIDDVKNLKQLLPRELLESKSIFIDSDNVFSSGDLKSSYPIEMFIEDGSIIEKREFTRP